MPRKPWTFEDTLLSIVVAVAIIAIIWLLSGCGVLTQRTAKVTYTKGCAITVEGMEVQRAAETARQISMEDCKVISDTKAEETNDD